MVENGIKDRKDLVYFLAVFNEFVKRHKVEQWDSLHLLSQIQLYRKSAYTGTV